MIHRTITKTAEHLKVECNDVEVLYLVFADNAKADCAQEWSKDVIKLSFHSSDKASDEYRRKPPGLKASMKWVW